MKFTDRRDDRVVVAIPRKGRGQRAPGLAAGEIPDPEGHGR